MFVRGARLAIALAVLAAVTAGCSDSGSKPVALPSISPTATTSASPSAAPTATELAAVSAVVRRYFELINGPTTTTAANELSAMMTTACRCRRAATSIADLATKHRHYFGGATLVDVVPTLDSMDTADVLVQYNYGAGGIKDAKGNVIVRTAGRTGVKVDFRLMRDHGAWKIDAIETLNEGRSH